MLSKEEQKFITSRVKLQGVADKIGGISREYVGMIFRGERDVKSKKAQKVAMEFQRVLEELHARNSETIYAPVKNGFVLENGTITDDEVEARFKTLQTATAFLLKKNTPEDYYINQQEFDGLYWVSIEGTEKYIHELQKELLETNATELE